MKQKKIRKTWTGWDLKGRLVKLRKWNDGGRMTVIVRTLIITVWNTTQSGKLMKFSRNFLYPCHFLARHQTLVWAVLSRDGYDYDMIMITIMMMMTQRLQLFILSSLPVLIIVSYTYLWLWLSYISNFLVPLNNISTYTKHDGDDDRKRLNTWQWWRI